MRIEQFKEDKFIAGCIKRNQTAMNTLKEVISHYKHIAPEYCATYTFMKYKKAGKPISYTQYRQIKSRLSLEFPRNFYYTAQIG